jgi:hypothetical protein
MNVRNITSLLSSELTLAFFQRKTNENVGANITSNQRSAVVSFT